MAVTKLERKGRKNKTVAKVRVATIKRLRTKNTMGSENKEESGQIIGDAAEVIAAMSAKPAKATKAKTAKKAEPKAEVKEETAPEAVAEVATEENKEESAE